MGQIQHGRIQDGGPKSKIAELPSIELVWKVFLRSLIMNPVQLFRIQDGGYKMKDGIQKNQTFDTKFGVCGCFWCTRQTKMVDTSKYPRVYTKFTGYRNRTVKPKIIKIHLRKFW